MRSAVVVLFSLSSIALADSACPARSTVTVTEYEQMYETPTKVAAADVKPSCIKSTTTTTTTEKVYVTITIDDTSNARETSSSVPVAYSVESTTKSSTRKESTLPYETVRQSKSVKPITEVGKSTEKPAYSTPVPQKPAVQSTAPQDSSPSAESGAHTSSSTTPESTQAATPLSSGSNAGEATFYGGNVGGGMCSFTGYTIPSGIYGTALSDSNWADAADCGACLQVTGPNGNKTIAMVVDQCPGCGQNHLDLFPDAFQQLADPSKGVIPVSWDIVPCGISSPIVLKNKEGTSNYWFSMQVMNSNVPVSKLEVSTDGGATWKETTRMDYNFFENSSGFGVDSLDVKVTSVTGGSIIVNNVSVDASTTATAGSNFS